MTNILLSTNMIKDDLQQYIDSHSKVTVVPFSFRTENIYDAKTFHDFYLKENGKYRNYITSDFNQFGISDDNITYVNYYLDTTETMINKINNSDILFLTWGLPNSAVSKVFEKNIYHTIKSYQKTIIGTSAGALMQMDRYFCSADDDYPQQEYYMGLGLLENDYYIEVHYNKENLEHKNILQQTANNLQKPVLALDDNSSIVVDGKEIILNGDVSVFEPAKHLNQL